MDLRSYKSQNMKNTNSAKDLLSATFYSCALDGAIYDKH